VKLVIGCPVYKRDWILPLWIRYVKSQGLNFKDVGFIFEVSPDDEATVSILEQWRKADNSLGLFDINV